MRERHDDEITLEALERAQEDLDLPAMHGPLEGRAEAPDVRPPRIADREAARKSIASKEPAA